MAMNAFEFVKFIAIQWLVDRRKRGKSGMTAFGRYGSLSASDGGLGEAMIDPIAANIAGALRPFGYNPGTAILSREL
jgi:hypothetical protein